MTLPRITAGDRDDIVASIKSIMRRYPLGARTFGKFAAIAREELTQETIGLAVAEEAGGGKALSRSLSNTRSPHLRGMGA